MKKYIIIILAFFVFVQAKAQDSPLARIVESNQLEGADFKAFQLFEQDQTIQNRPDMDGIFKQANFYKLNTTQLKEVVKTNPKAISLDFSTNREIINLQLVRHQVLTDDFTLIGSESDEAIPYTPGTYYRGLVNGDPSSFAAISFFDDEVIAVLSTPRNGSYVLGKVLGENTHIGYYEEDLLVSGGSACETPDPDYTREEIDRLRELANTVAGSRVDNCVKVYLELEYDLVTEKGGSTGAANFITGLYNVVATLYQNESITTQISQIFTWTSPDGYVTSSTTDALYDFRSTRPSYNGDLAHLISRGAPAGGGVAFIGGLCNSYGYAYSYIYSTYSNYPTYSWSVNVVAHEMGHNLGSPHTHACSWSGGAIDGCGPAAGYSEGCNGPLPGANQGTVMSYCHLVSSVGIGPPAGFGTQPGNLIRNNITNASCLSTCGSHCPSTLNLTGTQSGTQNYEASSTINSTQTLTSSANVDYKAGSLIKLNPGFVATSGSDFRAYIGNCSGNFAGDSPETVYEEEANENLASTLDDPAMALSDDLLHCYPNPFQGSTTIEYKITMESPIRLTLHDLNGRLIQELEQGQVSEGLHRSTFNAGDLPPGMYYVKLQAEGSMRTAKLMLLK